MDAKKINLKTLLGKSSDELSEKKERARGYLEGYEAGLKEAWKDFISLCTKGYQPREMRILAKSKMVNIQGKVDAERRRAETRIGESLDEPVPDVETGGTVAEIGPGRTYLVEGEIPDKGLAIMRSLLEKGWDGLCVSRMEPGRIAEHLEREARIIWLTKTEVPDSAKGNLADVDFRILSPTNLDMLTTIMIDFLRGEGGKVVMFGGLDFLMTYNEFGRLLRLLQSMKDRMAFSGAIMLVPYDPKLLEEKDLRKLRSEIEERL